MKSFYSFLAEQYKLIDEGMSLSRTKINGSDIKRGLKNKSLLKPTDGMVCIQFDYDTPQTIKERLKNIKANVKVYYAYAHSILGDFNQTYQYIVVGDAKEVIKFLEQMRLDGDGVDSIDYREKTFQVTLTGDAAKLIPQEKVKSKLNVKKAQVHNAIKIEKHTISASDIYFNYPNNKTKIKTTDGIIAVQVGNADIDAAEEFFSNESSANVKIYPAPNSKSVYGALDYQYIVVGDAKEVIKFLKDIGEDGSDKFGYGFKSIDHREKRFQVTLTGDAAKFMRLTTSVKIKEKRAIPPIKLNISDFFNIDVPQWFINNDIKYESDYYSYIESYVNETIDKLNEYWYDKHKICKWYIKSDNGSRISFPMILKPGETNVKGSFYLYAELLIDKNTILPKNEDSYMNAIRANKKIIDSINKQLNIISKEFNSFDCVSTNYNTSVFTAKHVDSDEYLKRRAKEAIKNYSVSTFTVVKQAYRVECKHAFEALKKSREYHN